MNWSELFAYSVSSLCLNWICFHMSFVQGREIIECPIEFQLAEGDLTAYVYNVSFSNILDHSCIASPFLHAHLFCMSTATVVLKVDV